MIQGFVDSGYDTLSALQAKCVLVNVNDDFAPPAGWSFSSKRLGWVRDALTQ